MEQIKILETKLATYSKWIAQAAKATTIGEVDQAKVEGLKAFNDLAYTISKSHRALLDATRDRRAELIDASFRQARATAQRVNSKTQQRVDAILEAEKPRDTTKAKTAKKATKGKKAKK